MLILVPNITLLSFTLVSHTGSSQSIFYLVSRGKFLKWIMAPNDLLVTVKFPPVWSYFSLRSDPGSLLCHLLPSGRQTFTTRGSHSLSLVFWIQLSFTSPPLHNPTHPLALILDATSSRKCPRLTSRTCQLELPTLQHPMLSHDPLLSFCPSSLQTMSIKRAGDAFAVKSPHFILCLANSSASKV